VNIYQFGRKVLARLLHYPLARVGLVPGRLYHKNCWQELAAITIAQPIPVTHEALFEASA
jgi:hypothetical protein